MGSIPPACYQVSVTNPSIFWQTDNVLKSELPILAVQISFTVCASRLYYFIFKPLHQPRVISYVSAGILLTSIMGQVKALFGFIYPINGVLNVEVISHIGLIYYAFVSGLEMNFDTIIHAKKKAATIAVSGIIFPLVIGPALYSLHRKVYVTTIDTLEGATRHTYILWTLVLTVTGFPVLAHTLSELKLLHTGLGKTALTTAMVSDTYSWILFAMVFPFAVNSEKAMYSVLSTIVFVVVCIFVVRPTIGRYIDSKTDQDAWDDYQILYVVMGAFVCSFITDVLGTHAIVGAFVYGLILPHGKFSDLVISISDDFGSGFLAPLYFSGTGMRLILDSIFYQPNWPLSLLVILLLCLPKILSTLFSTFFFDMHSRDGLALGLLLNSKDTLAFLMLNNAWDRKFFSKPTYTVLTSAVLLMTVVVPPVINAMYKPRKRFEQNKLKTIQKLRQDVELRILACVHNTRHATGMISILDAFNPTRLSPMYAFGVYLVELTGRAAALVAAHIERPNSQLGGEQNLTRTQAELEAITNTFEAFGEAYDAVRVETLNVMSSYATIHEDIHNTANEKRASLILLPFHKQLTSEGSLDATNTIYKDINQNIMQGAPCSVGIFVDRDLGSLTKTNFRIIMIFVGGPDDREALAIAWRMAGHPRIRVSVIRMLLFDEAAEVDTTNHAEAQGILSAVMDNEKQKELDEEYVCSFRLTAVNNDESISYSEVDVHVADDISAVLNELEKSGCELYLVGQGNCRNLRVFSNLLEWCDCSELGVIGDILASNNFVSRASVLVVQQYGYGGMVFEKQHNYMTTTSDGFESLVVKTE